MPAEHLGPWQPLSPTEVATLFADVGAHWLIAGGWSIDLFIGRVTRVHEDTDVQICRADLLTFQAALPGWDLHAADPPGTLRRWLPGEVLLPAVHDIWCRPSPTAPWAFQFNVVDTDGDDWIYRRDPCVRLPLAAISRRSPDGLDYLAPEIQLLYKSKGLRPKDELDFTTVVGLLSPAARRWLDTALALASPDHPWRKRLL
ncbi:MAG: nucleotidyltransferase domain-containing protein [Devosia sp.]